MNFKCLITPINGYVDLHCIAWAYKRGVSVVTGSIFDFINSSGYRFNDQLNFFKLKNLVHHGNEIKYGEE